MAKSIDDSIADSAHYSLLATRYFFWGDFTHPTADGAKKAADQMVTFFTKDAAHGGSQFVQAWKAQ